MNGLCFFRNCDLSGKYRCSACHDAYYCSEEHQKLHWKEHKSLCCRKRKEKKEKVTSQEEVENSPVVSLSTEKRECRCMFCGENMILGSEEEAIHHMTVCPCLQEQLQSRDPITIPTILKKKMNMK
jgi:hypothetical protein